MRQRLCMLLLLSVTGPIVPAVAQPICSQPTAGLVACVAGRLCSCAYRPAAKMTGEPAGYRWDCSLLRPACGENTADPTIRQSPQSLPESLGIDNSVTTIQQRNQANPSPPPPIGRPVPRPPETSGPAPSPPSAMPKPGHF